MQLRRVIHELIHGQGDEVDKHDFNHRPEPRRCRADGETHDGAFADRRVDDAIGAKFLGQSFGDAEGAAKGDVFAEDVNGQIATHFFGESGADGFEVSLFRHGDM